MALQQTVTCQNGLVLENAYIKISMMNYDNNTKQVNVSINIFKNKEYADNNKPYVDQLYKTFTPDLINGKTMLEQCYQWLKENIFTTAIDLLDEGQTV